MALSTKLKYFGCCWRVPSGSKLTQVNSYDGVDNDSGGDNDDNGDGKDNDGDGNDGGDGNDDKDDDDDGDGHDVVRPFPQASSSLHRGSLNGDDEGDGKDDKGDGKDEDADDKDDDGDDNDDDVDGDDVVRPFPQGPPPRSTGVPVVSLSC